MADAWQGFDRDQMRAWLAEAGLVNVIVDCSGLSCCAETTNASIADAQGRKVSIGVFVATGTRRMKMREAVQSAYGARALAGSQSSCCAPDGTSAEGNKSCCSGTQYEEVAFTPGYSQDEISSAPQEAAEISLGCGNPTAIANLKPGEVVLDIGSPGAGWTRSWLPKGLGRRAG